MTLQATATVDIPRAVHDVFEAIVDPAGMANYFISSGSGRLEAGQTVTWRWADVGAELPIRVLAVEPDRLVRFSWPATGSDTEVDILLSQTGDGTQVEVVERGWPADEAGIAAYGQQIGGWVDMLLGLKAYLLYGVNLRAGSPLPVS